MKNIPKNVAVFIGLGALFMTACGQQPPTVPGADMPEAEKRAVATLFSPLAPQGTIVKAYRVFGPGEENGAAAFQDGVDYVADAAIFKKCLSDSWNDGVAGENRFQQQAEALAQSGDLPVRRFVEVILSRGSGSGQEQGIPFAGTLYGRVCPPAPAH